MGAYELLSKFLGLSRDLSKVGIGSLSLVN